MTSELQLNSFYTGLEAATAAELQRAAADIHARMKRAAEAVVVIGKRLQDAKELLGHGEFMDWIKAEFGMSVSTAENLMRVALVFGDTKIANFANLGVSVLYELAAPSTPEAVRTKILERTEHGERPTVADVREEKRAAQPAPPVVHIVADPPDPTEPAPNVLTSAGLRKAAEEARLRFERMGLGPQRLSRLRDADNPYLGWVLSLRPFVDKIVSSDDAMSLTKPLIDAVLSHLREPRQRGLFLAQLRELLDELEDRRLDS